jgi:hypothetical protein
VGLEVCPRGLLTPAAVALTGLALCAAPGSPTGQVEREVAGQVLVNGRPAAGALVRGQGTGDVTRTADSGRFRLRTAASRVTAWLAGHFVAGAAVGEGPVRIDLHPLPGQDDESYRWVDPAADPASPHACANCHERIFTEWAGSPHARAGRNRRFLNLYDGTDWEGRPGRGWNLLRDNPDGASTCSACHAPSVGFDEPGYEDFRRLKGVAARGVHCDYCHKIAEVRTDKLGTEHGRFAHDLLRPGRGQLFFGPLDDADRGDDAFSPVYRESRYCAGCHEGTLFGIPVYTTYSEWLVSPARRDGKQCQTCHMAPSGSLTNVAPGHGGIDRSPRALATHDTTGATPDRLRSCLELSVDVRRAGGVEVRVKTLATEVGHRVPTGFIDRHLLLVIESEGVGGEPRLALKGPTLPAVAGNGAAGEGAWAGLAGKFYGKLLEGPQGERPAPFWQPGRLIADMRLAPGSADQAEWTFPPETSTVRVRLVYRRFYQAVRHAKGWPDEDVVIFDERLRVPGDGKASAHRFPRREK